MSLFDTVQDNDIVEEIRNLDMSHLTPMEAMNILYNLQIKYRTAGKRLSGQSRQKEEREVGFEEDAQF